MRSLYKKRFFAFIISLVADTFAGVVVKGFEICKNFFARVFFSPPFISFSKKSLTYTQSSGYILRRNELVYKNLYTILWNQVGEFRHTESNFSYGGKKN